MNLISSEKSIYGPQLNPRHWIDGEFVDSRGQTIPSINPANHKDCLGEFPIGDTAEIEKAVCVANRSFKTWSRTPAPIRGNFIGRLSQVLEREKENLAKIITREIGKPYKESLGEVQEAIDTAQFFQSEGRRLYGQTVPSELPNKELMTYRRPLGVCLMITASNFPFAVPSWKIIPALLTGNTVIWKPSQDAPATALAFALCFKEAGIPNGVVNLVFGDGTTGQKLLEWVEKSQIHKVSFTGSSAVGRKIGEICGRSLQTPSLELGGKNPLIINHDANLEKAIPTSIVSSFGTGGQRCTSTGSIIVHEKVFDEFEKRFIAEAKKIRIGNPLLNHDVLYGPLFAERYLNTFVDHLKWGEEDGAKRLLGNGRITPDNPYEHFVGENPSDGWYVTPTVWTNVRPEMRLFQEEIFGPSINLVKAKSFEEALEFANDHPYGLSSAIFTQDPLTMLQFKEGIMAGMSSINNSTTGAEAHLPFGGVRASGNGTRESGIWVIESYTRWHCVNVDLAPSLQLAQMDVDYGGFKETVSFKEWVSA